MPRDGSRAAGRLEISRQRRRPRRPCHFPAQHYPQRHLLTRTPDILKDDKRFENVLPFPLFLISYPAAITLYLLYPLVCVFPAHHERRRNFNCLCVMGEMSRRLISSTHETESVPQRGTTPPPKPEPARAGPPSLEASQVILWRGVSSMPAPELNHQVNHYLMRCW